MRYTVEVDDPTWIEHIYVLFGFTSVKDEVSME